MREIFQWATSQGEVNPSVLDTLALLARFVFAATLFMFFWNSAFTKFDGFLNLSDGAYIQIFPQAVEAAGYNTSQLAWWRKVVVFFGSVSEFVLPLFIVLGLFTRASAIAMIGFIAVMTMTDIWGHHAEIGSWFRSASAQNIAGVRLYWVFLLLVLTVIGGGWLSMDRLILRRKNS